MNHSCVSWAMFLRLWALCLVAHLTPQILALDAKTVFETVSPSAVFIEDVDGFGSGVFLNEKGLILTNYHVVAANIALKVRAKVRFGNRLALTELDNVKITHIHKDYDLAILQVQPPANGVFIPARVIPQAPPLSTGIKCYAIGNPGGPQGKALELSITEGLVSAAFRKVDNLDYTQISAQINPGNSGGPICNELGQVIGIATWKMTETEGIGFAIPMQRLNMSDFIDPKTKPVDVALVKKAEAFADKYYTLAQAAVGRDREALLMMCVEAYRVSMLASPNSPTPYRNLAVVNRQLGNVELAKKYAEAALRIDPNYSACCHMLGSIMIQASDQNLNPALEIWFRGLNGTGDAADRGDCADDLAVVSINQQKWVAAGYMLQWWETFASSDNDPRRARRQKLWAALKDKLPQTDMDALRSKTGGFSKVQFDALAAGKPLAGIIAIAPGPANATPAIPGATPPSVTATPSTTPEQRARIVKDAAAKFGPSIVTVPPEGLECPLPDVAENAVLAYAGWQMIVLFPDLMKLGVMNLASGKLEGFIDCADRKPLFAAGGQVLTVYSPSSRALDVYDLATRKKIGSKTMPADAPVRFVGMGLLNPAEVFVLQPVPTGAPGALRPALLKVPNLTATELLPEVANAVYPPMLMGTPATELKGAMDETGASAAVARLTGNPAGLGQYTILGGNRFRYNYEHISDGVPTVSGDGKYIVNRRALRNALTGDRTADGNLLIKNSPAYFLAPIAGYSGYVALERNQGEQGFRAFALPAMSQLVKLPLTEATMAKLTHASERDQKELMLASAYCDRIAYLLPTEKKLMLFPLGLKSGAPGSGFAVPGKRFERKLTVPAGATVTIQSAPQGLRYEPSTTALIWEVPATTKTGQMIQVIILVKGADSKESYVVEKISVP